MSKKTHDLALAGMFCALAVTFLWLGGILPLATYLWPVLASFTLLPVRETCPKSYAWSAFAASALLGLLLCADKECALVYCALGYYPLIKPRLDALSPAPLRWGCKLGVGAAATGAMYALILLVFRLDAVVREFQSSAPWLLWATAGLGVLLFIVYDLALGRLGLLYRRRHGK